MFYLLLLLTEGLMLGAFLHVLFAPFPRRNCAKVGQPEDNDMLIPDFAVLGVCQSISRLSIAEELASEPDEAKTPPAHGEHRIRITRKQKRNSSSVNG